MISRDDIEAFEDNDALTRAENRLKSGTVRMREAPSQDTVGIIRAGVMWRNIACQLFAQMEARQRDAMSIGEPEDAGQP